MNMALIDSDRHTLSGGHLCVMVEFQVYQSVCLRTFVSRAIKFNSSLGVKLCSNRLKVVVQQRNVLNPPDESQLSDLLLPVCKDPKVCCSSQKICRPQKCLDPSNSVSESYGEGSVPFIQNTT